MRSPKTGFNWTQKYGKQLRWFVGLSWFYIYIYIYIYHNFENRKFWKDWKRQAPNNDEEPSKLFLGILDMGSISIQTHGMDLLNLLKLWSFENWKLWSFEDFENIRKTHNLHGFARLAGVTMTPKTNCSWSGVAMILLKTRGKSQII